MPDPRRLSDSDLDRILSGRGSLLDADADLRAFFDEVRKACSAAPSDRARTRHLSAIASELQGQGASGRASQPASPATRPARARRSRPRLRLALLGAVLALALPLATAGLATAGVALPQGLRAPFETLGIELPNQASAPEVHAVIEETPADERGCAFGRRVARAASDGKGGSRRPCPQAPEGREPTSGAGGTRGRDRATEVRDRRSIAEPAGRSFGSGTAVGARESARWDRRSFGEGTADGARELGSPRAESGRGAGDRATGGSDGRSYDRTAPVGPGSPGGDSGQEPSAGGRSTAEGQSEEGRSIGGSAAEDRRP